MVFFHCAPIVFSSIFSNILLYVAFIITAMSSIQVEISSANGAVTQMYAQREMGI